VVIVLPSHLSLELAKPPHDRRPVKRRLDDDGPSGWRDCRGMGRGKNGRARQAISGSELEGALSRAEIV
jgi:hypothetical protein